MVGEDWSCEQDVRLVSGDFHIRLGEVRKERSDNLSLEVRFGRERQVVRGASFTCGFDIDQITQIVWFRFMKESNRNMILHCIPFSILSQ